MAPSIHKIAYDEDADATRTDAATRVMGCEREATVAMPGAAFIAAYIARSLAEGSEHPPSGPTIPAAAPLVELDAAQLGALSLDSAPRSEPRLLPASASMRVSPLATIGAAPRSASTTVTARSVPAPARERPTIGIIFATIVAMSFVAGAAGALVLYYFF